MRSLLSKRCFNFTYLTSLDGAGSSAGIGAARRLTVSRSRIVLQAAPSLQDKTIPELKELLKERGLPISGRKAELIARLQEAAKDASSANDGKEEEENTGPRHWRDVEGPNPFPQWNFTENATHRPSPWGPVIKPRWEGMEFADDQGKMLDGSGYMCLDGVVRKGDPYSVNQTEDFYGWLTEWVVAARTGQLREDDPHANKAYMKKDGAKVSSKKSTKP